MGWTPALGTRALESRLGTDRALAMLVDLLAGRTSGTDLLEPDQAEALLDIGGGHAERLMDDPTGGRLAYWPRTWAARAMAYLGDVRAGPALIEALGDEHWRARMTAAQTLGRLGVRGGSEPLVALLDDEHPRVRAAAVVALGRVGDEEALAPLAARCAALPPGQVERALAAIERRIWVPSTSSGAYDLPN